MRSTCLLILSLLIVAGGCARVVDKVTRELDQREIYEIAIPAQKSALKVEVKVESPGKLTGCLYPASKDGAVSNQLYANKQPTEALAFQTGEGTFTLSGTMPAGEEGRVWLKNIGTEKVTLKVNITGY